jgi:spermidine/putrescine transport system ATP-binding protein
MIPQRTSVVPFDPRARAQGSVGGDRSEVISLIGVSKTYAGSVAPALRSTDLTIGEGEFFSILGPSGSGKTTTLRLIAGFESPDRGIVRLGGQDVSQLPPERRDVNTVFQNYALFPHLTVAENIAFPLQMRKIPSREISTRIADALELVEMAGFGNRLPHQLSGGQRQRIALARALVGRPKVLLLDEPLGALDLRLRQQMQHALTTLQQQLGITFVYVTHDQGEALSMSDRVAIMSNGQIEQIGRPEDLYYAPKNEFVARFIGKSNILETEAKVIDGAICATISGTRIALPGFSKAGRVKVALRCESVGIDVVANREADLNLPGVVKNVLFLGSGLEVAVDCQGTDLLAIIPAPRERQVKIGDCVFCHFKGRDLVVLND